LAVLIYTGARIALLVSWREFANGPAMHRLSAILQKAFVGATGGGLHILHKGGQTADDS